VRKKFQKKIAFRREQTEGKRERSRRKALLIKERKRKVEGKKSYSSVRK